MSRTTRKGRSYSLKRQLGILFAALAIPLLGLQTWWSYHDYRSARQQAWDHALAFADAVDLGLRQFMDQSGQLLRSSAARSGPEWLADGDCSAGVESLQELLPFDNVFVVAEEGRILCSARRFPPDASAAAWSWFEDFRTAGEFMIAPPAEADFSESWILPLVAPIHDESGAFRGGLVGTMPLSELSRLLVAYRPPDEQLTTVATADRIVIARSVDAEQWVGRELPPPTGSDRLVAPGRWVAVGPDFTGIRRTWGQVRTGSGWIVYVGIPDEIVFGPALREALAHVGGTLLVVLLGVLLATHSYSRIAGALRELADKTRASDAADVVTLPPETPEEITEAVEQLNEMLRGRARAEAAERTARERFQSIFDNAVFGIYVSTVDGRFLQVNPALVEMLGYESEDALLEAGPTALYAHPEERRELVEDAVDSGRIETEARELEWLRADGTRIIVRVTGKLLGGPGGEPVFEMIVQDITEERRTEEELRQTQKMEAIGRLAGGVAHDFNNLLTVIGGNVELLEDDLDESDPLREDLKQIAKATQRASSLTRRLLSFSRRSRRGEQTLDLNEVVPELARMLVPLLGETVELETELQMEPRCVSIDPGELEQVVLNLVLNARDAIRGGGRIVIRTKDADREDSGMWRRGVMLAVTDDGVGMDEETRRRIFEPFYTTKPMGQGTGLGLATVYGIIKRAGGDIQVESESGRGTRVEIWLPQVSEPTQVSEVGAEAAPVSGSESILVVEDDELVRRFVERALRDAGFDVHVAESGDAALELMRTRAPAVDLVLTDVVMPGLSGPELADELARVAPEIPILFMSGYIDKPFFSDEFEHRPESLLRKPFSLTELRRQVREALDRGAETAATG